MISDQDIAAMRDAIPRVWWNLYQGSLTVGFDERQSMSLVMAWMMAQNPHGIRPDNLSGPKSDA